MPLCIYITQTPESPRIITSIYRIPQTYEISTIHHIVRLNPISLRKFFSGLNEIFDSKMTRIKMAPKLQDGIIPAMPPCGSQRTVITWNVVGHCNGVTLQSSPYHIRSNKIWVVHGSNTDGQSDTYVRTLWRVSAHHHPPGRRLHSTLVMYPTLTDDGKTVKQTGWATRCPPLLFFFLLCKYKKKKRRMR